MASGPRLIGQAQLWRQRFPGGLGHPLSSLNGLSPYSLQSPRPPQLWEDLLPNSHLCYRSGPDTQRGKGICSSSCVSQVTRTLVFLNPPCFHFSLGDLKKLNFNHGRGSQPHPLGPLVGLASTIFRPISPTL